MREDEQRVYERAKRGRCALGWQLVRGRKFLRFCARAIRHPHIPAIMTANETTQQQLKKLAHAPPATLLPTRRGLDTSAAPISPIPPSHAGSLARRSCSSSPSRSPAATIARSPAPRAPAPAAAGGAASGEHTLGGCSTAQQSCKALRVVGVRGGVSARRRPLAGGRLRRVCWRCRCCWCRCRCRTHHGTVLSPVFAFASRGNRML
jgi:hypothetical protein